MAKAMLHSRDMDGLHRTDLADVKILSVAGNNDYIVETPDGIHCHALFNAVDPGMRVYYASTLCHTQFSLI